MIKQILLCIFLTIPVFCFAQESSESYFKDQFLRKEISKEKASYTKVVTKNEDGSLTTSVKSLKKNEVIRSQTYKGPEPVGIWVIQFGSGPKSIDYSFELKYSEEKCSEEKSLNIKDYFTDNDSIGYKAPKISTGEKSFGHFVGKNVVYPMDAMREGIDGTVIVNFTITKEGNIENVHIQQGRNILLDKEAVRVIKNAKLATPPTLNGQSHEVCVSMPVNFRIL